MSHQKVARRYIVRGRVQGVGYRYFAEKSANELGLRGYVRNLDDGSVEAYAVGNPEQLSEFSGLLRKGPRFAEANGTYR